MEFFSMYHGTFLLVIPLLSRDSVSPPTDKACRFFSTHPPWKRKLHRRFVFLLLPRPVLNTRVQRTPLSALESMDALQCLSLTLLLLHQAMCSSVGAEVTGAVGRSVTFHLQNLDGNTVAWSFHHDVIVAVKFGSPPEALFFDDKYKPRLAFPKNGSALTISQLRMGDAGTYTAKTATGAKTTFTLHVYRELVVLTVTCAVQNCSANGCRYALHCTALESGYGNVSYGWSLGGLWSEGPTILVEESPPEKLLLMCMAQNPVSSHNTTVVSPAALCAENTTYPPITGTYSSRQAGIVAAAVTGVGVLLAVVIFLIYCKSKGWKNFHLPAVEATNTVCCWKTSCQTTKKEPRVQP